jgi:hypothetical protein
MLKNDSENMKTAGRKFLTDSPAVSEAAYPSFDCAGRIRSQTLPTEKTISCQNKDFFADDN